MIGRPVPERLADGPLVAGLLDEWALSLWAAGLLVLAIRWAQRPPR